jgi:hypothetical protein
MFNVGFIYLCSVRMSVSALHAPTRQEPPHHGYYDDYNDYPYEYLSHISIMPKAQRINLRTSKREDKMRLRTIRGT